MEVQKEYQGLVHVNISLIYDRMNLNLNVSGNISNQDRFVSQWPTQPLLKFVAFLIAQTDKT